MVSFKLSKLCNRISSYSSTIDSQASYLYNRIHSFLSTTSLYSKTLLPYHAYIIASGHGQNKFIASKVIAFYASLNQPHFSTKVFDSLTCKDTFLWNSIIKAHFGSGGYDQALGFFSNMRFLGNLPDQFTVPMVVSACAELGFLFDGMNLHSLVLKVNLFDKNSAVGSSLTYMYAKCGALEDACHVFEEIPVKDVVSWTVLVIGHVQSGESYKALEYLCQMHKTGEDAERPNDRTLGGGLQACGDSGALTAGRSLHGLVVKSGFMSADFIQSAVLSMYSKCQSIEDARASFCDVMSKDLISWTSIINAYAKSGCVHECFQMFQRMLASGVYPDGMVISCLFSCFSNSMKGFEGKAFHGFILKRNYEFDQIVCNSLLSMYFKFGLVAVAEKLFFGGCIKEKDTWNLMILGYDKSGLEKKCIHLFKEMKHQGIELDSNCLISVVSSCSRLEAIKFGQSVHCHTIKTFVDGNISVVNCLISMYGKCGNLPAALNLFHETTQDTPTTWNALMSSYAVNGRFLEALNLFDEMVSNGLKPDGATLAISLSACAQSASLEKGRNIHNYIREAGLGHEVSLGTSLVDMYAKCGEINMAKEIFDSMEEKDVVSWTVMISCYGMHGHGKSAVSIFNQMEETGVSPTGLAFLAVLSACAHAGLVDEAELLFNKMKEYSLMPTLKHYACLVDVYGKLGCLDEAESLILSMPFSADGGIWGSLLTACKTHNNAEMGIKIAKRAIEADPKNDGYYILLSDFYSSMEMWEDVGQVRKMMKERGVRKTVGWSMV